MSGIFFRLPAGRQGLPLEASKKSPVQSFVRENFRRIKGGEIHLNKKLYVGNLPYSATTDELKQHFSQAGSVIDAVVISDNRTGRSKGFGFVEYEKEEDAKKAIEMFNGKDFAGRNIVVNEARPKPETGQGVPSPTTA